MSRRSRTADGPKAFADDESRYRAIEQRDQTADGVFVFAVTTTGIYCRPSCPSRPARRENIKFFASTAAAVRSGFRACKRCRPDQADSVGHHAAKIIEACRSLKTEEIKPSLNELARQAGMSRFHFHRLFRSITGVTPKSYAAAQRAQAVRDQLQEGPSVTETIYAAGFNSSARFYAEAQSVLGMTPRRYRSGGAGEIIRFAVGQCTLGAILAASSAAGVCAILMGDDPGELVRDLQDRFPKAKLVGADRDYEQIMAQVVGMIEEPRAAGQLPLDIRGTAFQRRVWEALRRIPVGQTLSYSELAEKVGSPAAVRAVAGACAANAHAVAIPCHRVVRTDGSLSGYRWGVERKRELLDRERSAAAATS